MKTGNAGLQLAILDSSLYLPALNLNLNLNLVTILTFQQPISKNNEGGMEPVEAKEQAILRISF